MQAEKASGCYIRVILPRVFIDSKRAMTVEFAASRDSSSVTLSYFKAPVDIVSSLLYFL